MVIIKGVKDCISNPIAIGSTCSDGATKAVYTFINWRVAVIYVGLFSPAFDLTPSPLRRRGEPDSEN